MGDIQWIPLIFVTLLTIGTIGLGIYVQKSVKSAADMYVASRAVSVPMNSAAISGEYLSAASFMGVAGMIMKSGYDVLWYPVLYATGYLFLLLFIAGPLRRFGAYTIPDFAEGRYNSPVFRKIAVIFVLTIGFFYTMPQMKGAGVALVNILHTPYWVGVVLVGLVVTFNVALGGMKGITFVQAFQYWVKMLAISIPMIIMFMFWGSYPGNMAKLGSEGDAGKRLPTFEENYNMNYKPIAPLNTLVFPAEITATFTNGAMVAIAPSAKVKPEHDPITPDKLLSTTIPIETKEIDVAGKMTKVYVFPAGSEITSVKSFEVTQGGQTATTINPSNGEEVPLTTVTKLTVYPLDGQEYVNVAYAKGQVVPNTPNDESWLKPFGPFTAKYGHPLLYTYSLILAIICGTAGLPHILVRFYTNPDGRTAKKTAFWVMILLGCFYLFPPMFGVLGRNVIPQLYAITGGSYSTDSVVLILPRMLDNYVPYLGSILSGITSAGAFAGFMTTFSGLLVSITGALAHDVYGNMINPKASPSKRLKAFRISAMLGGATAMLLGSFVENFDINMMVGWAFAIGAASYFPMLIISTWWRKTTAIGAGTGMLVGGGAALFAIVSTMLADKQVIPALGPWFAAHPIIRTIAEQPAIWAVPFSMTLIIVVSLMTQNTVPKDASWKMLILHAPEELGLKGDYIKEDNPPAGTH